MQDARTRLEAILRERIAVLDGSWGVLIQREVRGEEAYRGERFKEHSRDVAGDPDRPGGLPPRGLRVREDRGRRPPRAAGCRRGRWLRRRVGRPSERHALAV